MKKRLFFLMCKNGILSHFGLLFFRVAVAFELLFVHGLKKIGIGVAIAETVPNPLGLPEFFNQAFAIVANIIMPLFIAAGLFTKLATLPILAVTLSGFFIVHFNDPIAIRDIPFMYSVCFLFLTIVGPGKYSLDYYFLNK